MDASDEERRKTQKTGELIDEKMLKIMNLQGEIDRLLRDVESSPFSSQKWQNASLEAKQRVMAMAGIQFLIFEPVDRVDGNDKLKIAADNLLEVLGNQLKGMANSDEKRSSPMNSSQQPTRPKNAVHLKHLAFVFLLVTWSAHQSFAEDTTDARQSIHRIDATRQTTE